ncbi:glycosyltransferase family 2 protein [Flammeovirgaceae bacterium SG7u.111]|nr:glycosyltransferase family 2 protein [Flammeovirgaceae bacterium SG7u.132]WPO34797.1 glycosyltransferase family 2 protein [Flammeovirgaceae bacterium SG7u.111]
MGRFQDISVVILNYNTKQYLEQFLPLVKAYSEDAKIVVADNCSDDGSAAFIETHHPDVQLVNNPENLGFCAGYNYSLSLLENKYFLLLNSDIEVTPNWLEPMYELMESDETIACCQPKIKSYSEKEKFEYAGAAGGMIDFLGYPFSRGRVFDELEVDKGQYEGSADIFWATGASLLIRADLFKSFKGFDEFFFAHMEEIDLCWRLKNAGYRVCYTSKSEVFHIGGGTLSKSSPRKTFFNFRNALVILVKNLPFFRLVPIMFIRLVLDGVAGLRFLMLGEGKHCWAIAKAHLSIYKNIFLLLQKRKMVEGKKSFLTFQEVCKKSIVWQHFVLGKKTYRDF